MASGIKLNFGLDDNGDDIEAKITQSVEGEQCFGGAICPHCEHRESKIGDIRIYPIWCAVVDKSVATLDKCPQRRWVKLASPKVIYENFTEEVN